MLAPWIRRVVYGGYVGPDEVADAYNSRALVLADLLGATVSGADPDRRVIEPWADTVHGRILDVGSGTGRWAGHLAALGYTVEGIEPAEQFVDLARRNYPSVHFRLASIADLDGTDERWGGVLAWYSLIHMGPEELSEALTALHRTLEKEGSILLSFFTGHRLAAIDHPATTAYLWPMEDMSRALQQAGLEITVRHASVDSPHAYIIAHPQTDG